MIERAAGTRSRAKGSAIRRALGSEAVQQFAWVYLVALAFACAAAITLFGLLLRSDYQPDFALFWTTSRTPIGDVYSPVFAYPPTTVALLKAWPPTYSSARMFWLAISVGSFLLAASRFVGVRHLLIVASGPAVVHAAMTGQISLLVGALMMFGLSTKHEFARGIAFGLAAAIKPQLVFLFPVALVAVNDWKALAYAVATGAAAALFTLLLWGFQPWLDWLNILPQFKAALHSLQVIDRAITPASLASPYETMAAVPGTIAGCALIWAVFRRTADDLDRLAALSIGCLVSLPYAMAYDLSAVSVAAVPMLLNRKASLLTWAGAAMLFSTLLAPFGLIALAFAVFWRTRSTEAPPFD